MDFEYVPFKDYVKIARKIEYCGLSEECLKHLREMGITRAGEVLACSEKAIEGYGENAKWILEAKDFMEEWDGKLDFWEFGEDSDEFDDDIDKPWDIIHYIVEEIIHTYYLDYGIHTNNIDFIKENLNLSDKAKETLLNYGKNAFPLFCCCAKRLLLHSDNADKDGNGWDEQTVDAIRAFLSDILSLPQGIFEFFDEADAKWRSEDAE